MSSLLVTWRDTYASIFWQAVVWFIGTALLIFSIMSGAMVPDKWDSAVVLKVCGDSPIVRREDGTIWLRHRWRTYRVEDNWRELC